MLELMLDEVLPGMRKGSLVWRTRSGGNEGRDAFLSDNHEYVLVYAKPDFRFGGSAKSFAMYSNPDGDPRGDWRKSDMTVSVQYTDKRAGQAYYPLFDPENEIWYPCNPDAVWRYASRAKSGPKARIKTKYIEDYIEDGQVIFPERPHVETYQTKEQLLHAIRQRNVPKSGQSLLLREDLPDLDFWIGKRVGFGTPAFKRFKKDLKNATQPLSSWITPRSETDTVEKDVNAIVSGTNDEGAKSIKGLFGAKVFNYAKPPSLIRGLVEQATSPDDLVLDFFAGSATTAQAVMELNAADGGGRRFVVVSSTERTAEEPGKNLCRDVTARRVRQLNGRDDATVPPAAFAYLRCKGMAFEDLDYELAPAEAWAALEAMHGLPLTQYQPDRRWQLHERDGTAVAYVDDLAPDLMPALQDLHARRVAAFVYAWAPGRLRDALARGIEGGGSDLEVLGVRDTLVRRYRQ